MPQPIRFGITLGMHPDRPSPPEEMFSLAESVEALGFDSLWMGDHIAFHGGHFTEILTTLAALAARSSRPRTGCSRARLASVPATSPPVAITSPAAISAFAA